VESTILKDVTRTFTDLPFFVEDSEAGNNKLFNVLKAYANYDTEVSYVQGINYIVALMLLHIEDEEQVFWCLVNLMERYAWRWLYVDGLPKL